MARIVYSPLPRRRRASPKPAKPVPTIVRGTRARRVEFEPSAAENRPEDVFERLVAGLHSPRAGR